MGGGWIGHISCMASSVISSSTSDRCCMDEEGFQWPVALTPVHKSPRETEHRSHSPVKRGTVLQDALMPVNHQSSVCRKT